MNMQRIRQIEQNLTQRQGPTLRVRKDNSSSGVDTYVANFEEVAIMLNFPLEAILSWFSVIITPIGESTFLRHEFTEVDLQRLLDQFIEKYALCSYC